MIHHPNTSPPNPPLVAVNKNSDNQIDLRKCVQALLQGPVVGAATLNTIQPYRVS